VKLGKAHKGQDAAALQELQDIAASEKSIAADLALINVRLQRGMLDEALKAVDGLAAKIPDDPQPDYMRARVALLRKDSQKARVHLTQALERDGDFMPALTGLTSLDLVQGKPDDAKARLEKVVKRNGRHTGAMLALADLSERAGGSAEETGRWLKAAIAAAPQDPIPRAKLIDHLLRTNDIQAAGEAAQLAVAAFPADVGLLDRLGLVQMRQGEPRQAMTTFQKMIGLQPQSAQGYVRLAGAQTAGREFGAAAANLRLAVERAPDDPGVQRALAELSRAEGKPAAALAAAREMQARDKPGGLALEGDLHAQQKNWAAAAAAYRKAIALAPTTELALSLYGALLEDDRVGEARQAAAEWRKRYPNDMAYVTMLARTEMAAQKFGEAETIYREVLAREPGHVMALNNWRRCCWFKRSQGPWRWLSRQQS
jgi:putative PEP-CTERM system TPR-repeat lipoprotein